MIVGDPSEFAIESGISAAYEEHSLFALGFFRIHIAGHGFGVHAADATALGCSFSEVRRRISSRGTHNAPFASELEAAVVADAAYSACYATAPAPEPSLGLSPEEVRNLVYRNELLWAPDGDEAFDNGSFVLQFDVGDRVRLIGFQGNSDYRHVQGTLTQVWLRGDRFYELLQEWLEKFNAQWKAAKKVRGTIERSESK